MQVKVGAEWLEHGYPLLDMHFPHACLFMKLYDLASKLKYMLLEPHGKFDRDAGVRRK